MWLITNFGFFSVVQKPDDEHTNTLTVRARRKNDLETLRDRYIPEMTQIAVGAGTDYKYRAKGSRDALAAAHARIVQDIDYDNFKNSVARQQGYDRAHVYSKVWDVLYDLQDTEAGSAAEPPDSLVSTLVTLGTSYGGVLFDDEGRVLLREPTNHFDGYVWTFPKGRPDGTPTAEETALREVLEETGYDAEIVGRVPGTFAGGTSENVYFLMRPVGSAGQTDTETASIRWATSNEAFELIRRTTNTVGRERDLAVLRAALEEYHRSNR